MNSKPLQKDPLTAVRASCLLRSSLLREKALGREPLSLNISRDPTPPLSLSLSLVSLSSSIHRNKLIESSVRTWLRTVTKIIRVLIRTRSSPLIC